MFWWRQQIAAGVEAAFTDVDAGNLSLHAGDGDPVAVRQGRAQLAVAMGVDPAGLRFMNQVHSARVARADQLVPVDPPGPDAVPGPGSGSGPGSMDAMVSPTGQHPMAVMVADCLPVVLAGFAPGTGTVAATAVAHAGRQGLAAGILPATVRELKACMGAVEAAVHQGQVRAWIGPSVCGSCYEVPPGLAAEVAAAVPGSASTTRQGTTGLDLGAGAEAQLQALGVQTERVPGCTMEQDRLFSHRRNQRTGRFAGLVWRGQTD
ncbi:polyphenol oxidase family protein [Arthrobacter castelli]|uniref:polyphenol oxidase family protein n=1 Tax=Arthrobacter castelli TaxID=271431 RepID=UPI0004109A70|nr:polyphenol oxidase family protein [Arthrobacter castelli]